MPRPTGSSHCRRSTFRVILCSPYAESAVSVASQLPFLPFQGTMDAPGLPHASPASWSKVPTDCMRLPRGLSARDSPVTVPMFYLSACLSQLTGSSLKVGTTVYTSYVLNAPKEVTTASSASNRDLNCHPGFLSKRSFSKYREVFHC